MDDTSTRDTAVDLLKELGLKAYEAKCFVALSRLPQATAKEISEVSEVPRTRVYDAVKTLEDKGLVEIQHSNPQQFRAVDIDEAVGTLQRKYASRADSLRETLRGIDPVSTRETDDVSHEIWGLTGHSAISSRTEQLVDQAEAELVLVLGDPAVFSEGLAERLAAAQERGVTVIVGTVAEQLQDTVAERLPEAEVFVSGLEWLREGQLPEDQTEISRLLLVDRATILAGTITSHSGGAPDEQAVYGSGFDNGVVAITRRLLATGLLPGDDPAEDPADAE